MLRRVGLQCIGIHPPGQVRLPLTRIALLKLACLSQPAQLDIPLAAFREHEGSLSTRNRLAAMEEDMMVRLAHVGRHPLEKAMHYLRYFVRRQRALQAGSGR